MKLLPALTLCAVLPCFGDLSRQDLDQGWFQLFDGATLFGWSYDRTDYWMVTQAGNIHISGRDSGPLRTTSPFADFEMSLVFRSEEENSASIGLRCALKDGCAQTIPLERHSSNWHVVEIQARGDAVTAKIDSNPLKVTAGNSARVGWIELHGGSGKNLEFASIRLRPLNLHPVQNWKPLPGKTAFFSVRSDHGVHVEGGPGELKTREDFSDFVLQFEAEIHTSEETPKVRGGVFIRARAADLWSGYKVTLDNRFKEKDRTKPVDFGSGGIYGKQAARKILSKDRQPMAVTVIANGPHIATWVDGHQQVDWTDGAEDWPRSGVMSLQALEPETNVDFRRFMVENMR